MADPAAPYDVVILGSGLAGATLGAILARAGFKTLMLEADSHPRFAVGESTVPEFGARCRVLAKAFDGNAARLAISGDNPMMLSQQDPAKVARANRATSMAYRPALEKITGFDINWNIVSYPNPAWAKLVFPDDEEEVAIGKLAEAIFAASRVDREDPIAEWKAHNARLKERWRWHVVLKGEGKALGAFVRYAARKLPQPSGTRVVIDRDPVSML